VDKLDGFIVISVRKFCNHQQQRKAFVREILGVLNAEGDFVAGFDEWNVGFCRKLNFEEDLTISKSNLLPFAS
jgi:hypothetical protein